MSFSMLAFAGCACHSTSSASTQPVSQPTTQIEPLYESAQAAALAFTPPIALNEPPLELSRDMRERTAFVGYDELIRSYIYVRTDDGFSADGTDRYDRRAIIEKVGSSTR